MTVKTIANLAHHISWRRSSVQSAVLRGCAAALLTLVVVHANYFEATPLKITASYPDWVVDKSPENLCGGFFQDETGQWPPCDTCHDHVRVEADEAVWDEPHGLLRLRGRITFRHERQILTAEKAIASFNHQPASRKRFKTLEAHQNVTLYAPGWRLEGDWGHADLESHKQRFQSAAFRFYARQWHGRADEIEAQDDLQLRMQSATLTSCAPHSVKWHLKAKEVHLNKKTHRGQATHLRLYAGSSAIPLFYWPYLNFPIDAQRSTGFLYPLLQYSHSSGWNYALPFYWNLAPNYDLLLTPNHYEKRGMGLDGQWRQMTQRQSGTMEWSYLPKDTAYLNWASRTEVHHPSFLDSDPRVTTLKPRGTRYALHYQQGGTLAAWDWNVDYQRVSDSEYWTDFGSSLNATSTTQMPQSFRATRRHSGGQFSLLVQQYQTLHPFNAPPVETPYQYKPQLRFQQAWSLQPAWQFSVEGQWTHFSRAALPLLPPRSYTSGDRSWLRPSLAWTFETPAGFSKVTAQWDLTQYHLHLAPEERQSHYRSSLRRALPLLSWNTGLRLERPLQPTAWIQTLEPRLYALWIPYRDQSQIPLFDTAFIPFDANQLFSDRRFSGLDRMGDTKQITAALASRALQTATGQERLSFEVGRIFYLQPRKTTALRLPPKASPEERAIHRALRREHALSRHSDYIVQGEAHWWDAPGRALRVRYGVQWNHPLKTVVQQTLGLYWQPGRNDLAYVGYQAARHDCTSFDGSHVQSTPRLKQIELAGSTTLTPGWHALGRWIWNVQERFSREWMGGLEYQTCCTSIRVGISRRALLSSTLEQGRPYETRFLLEFALKNLGSLRQGQSWDRFAAYPSP